MIGFYIKNNRCVVIQELSLYDKNHDLHEILNNIPYNQKKCCFCLNEFLENVELTEQYKNENGKNVEGLNLDWFNTRILLLNCNHIFHLCCFTKYIKSNYNEYIFSNINIDNINQNENNNNFTSISRSSSNTSRSSSKTSRLSSNNLSIVEYFKYINNSIKDIEINSEKSLETTLPLPQKKNKNKSESYYVTESSEIIESSDGDGFVLDCPLCKKKVNNGCISSILDKYKLLLELYA